MRPRVLILGAGIAGLSVALRMGKRTDVILIAKSDCMEGATRYAQGGIASVWSANDSFDEHKKDTIDAGAGLCHEDIVDICVREGPSRVHELVEMGVPFSRLDPSVPALSNADPTEVFDLHREGGHRKRRVLHADDMTGLAIEETLLKAVRNNPSITILEHHMAVDLITEGKILKKRINPDRCLGAYVLDEGSGNVLTMAADVTVLATGGAGKAYLYTSNPDIATGDGIAMAYRAGARVANLEFIQFHPTCLFHPEAKTFLISEALRGEGAVLKNITGREFMDTYHPMGSLAPRDIVARAVDMEMKKTGDKHVLLDATRISAENLRKKFPYIHATCRKFSIDIETMSIPVVPAAHYICGGVLVDSSGHTSIDGLYAVGEVACTGLHGANRLASNSLLEAVVFAHRVNEHAEKFLSGMLPANVDLSRSTLPEWDTGLAVKMEERIDIAVTWHEIRSLMWNYVGIVRSNNRLERAQRRIDLIKSEVRRYFWDYLPTKDLIELRNLLQVSELIIQCASLRKESRGLHYTVDYPERNDDYFGSDTVI